MTNKIKRLECNTAIRAISEIIQSLNELIDKVEKLEEENSYLQGLCAALLVRANKNL